MSGLDTEAQAHARKVRDIHLGDMGTLIDEKLAESEAYWDARMDALAERIARLERENPPAVAAAGAVLDEMQAVRA